MNARRALNGAWFGWLAVLDTSPSLRQYATTHSLLMGLEALVAEAQWRTPYCGGNSEVWMHEECGEPIFAWTAVVWSSSSPTQDGTHG